MQAATTSDRDYWAAFTLDGEDGGFRSRFGFTRSLGRR